jgi:hypothetical protein
LSRMKNKLHWIIRTVRFWFARLPIWRVCGFLRGGYEIEAIGVRVEESYQPEHFENSFLIQRTLITGSKRFKLPVIFRKIRFNPRQTVRFLKCSD